MLLDLTQNCNLLASTDMARGVSIAITGMLIVLTALVLIGTFIAGLPHVLAIVAKFWPETEHRRAKPTHPESTMSDDDSVLAAIGYLLRLKSQGKLPRGRL
jgi:Na+-transporting methylmalonyl-CoA/oxaloacetate decarboxylase gamma subunit